MDTVYYKTSEINDLNKLDALNNEIYSNFIKTIEEKTQQYLQTKPNKESENDASYSVVLTYNHVENIHTLYVQTNLKRPGEKAELAEQLDFFAKQWFLNALFYINENGDFELVPS